jgi:hypothetical protein
MENILNRSRMLQVTLSNRGVQSNDAVRLDQFLEAMSGVSQLGHTHTIEEIEGLDQVKFYADQSDTIVWAYQAPILTANVRLEANGGLMVTSGVGIGIDFGGGTNQAARGDHSHAQLHNAVTLVSGVTILWSQTDQLIGAEVRFGSARGLKQDSEGLAIDFGSSPGQVASGNHTHAQLHDALTTQDSSSIALTLVSGTQQLSADLRMAAGSGLVSGVGGISLDWGSGNAQVPRGDHGHTDATQSAPGFLSVADKQKIDLYASLLNADECVPFYREDICQAGNYVGGRRRWGQAMQITEMHLTANPPTGVTCVLGLEVDGAIVEQITIPAGTPPTEVNNQKTLSGIYVAATKYVRLKLVSGVGTPELEPARIDCAITVKPAIASLSAVKINAGGGSVSPFIADAFYGSGATTQSSSNAIDVGGVSSPAPSGVYQTARAKYSDPNPFSYVVTGLARGISYTVRLHFAELFWSAAGKQKMNIAVMGKTTVTLSNYDTLNETSGVKFKAVIKEFTVEPDNNGQLEVRLTPLASTDSLYNLSINGVELVPNG